ncbi:hypothetical protein RvY_03643 [Ramazzottius varieornatus]|uniref:JmjC domain-containing protein n=1 Tax=Ramazzottius varieornatus TaxID=947166 RepID=A0A1D1US60_RAMVA|nr:hypothetical protein RvY_03643 [Ramazzottius varieornatus]
MSQTSVLRSNDSRELVEDWILNLRKPCIIRDCAVGECLTKWKPDYMASTVGHKPVSVHESSSNRLRFLKKNFTYVVLPFAEFIQKASCFSRAGCGDCAGDDCDRRYYYYRAVADDVRNTPSDFRRDFPSLSPDFTVPSFLQPEKIFSCVLRCSSADLGLWLHYDVLDNVLVQVRGRKRAILFNPEDAEYLYLSGDKSLIHDPENVDLEEFPLFVKARPYVYQLEPGDVLFIPAFWLHYMISEDFSVAVNIFWYNLPRELYDQKDTYGNKELQPYFRAAQGVDRALKQLEGLPIDIQRFYMRMLRSKIDKALGLSRDRSA